MIVKDTERVVIYRCEDGIAHLTLNRPRQINAFNLQMRDELFETLCLFQDDPNAKVGLLRGGGERGFCAGADLTEFGTAPSQVVARSVRWERDLWGLFRELRKPLIASLHGYVIGSGIEIAALCDIRIASDDCKFRMPEIALGMIPAAGGTQTLARLVKASNALDIILTNRLIFSEQARKIGLVDRVVAFSELTEKSEELAKELSQMDLKIVAAAKRAVIEGSDLELKVGIQLERRMAHILESQKR